MPTITDPFFKKLYTKLVEEIDSRVNTLARGSALILGQNTGLDVATTAMKYQSQVSYIEALQAVIELGIELDHERYGNNKED